MAEGLPANWNPNDDPNTTNVPYLAWRGENIRLVDCFGAADFTRYRNQQHPELLSQNVADVTDSQISNIFGSIVQTNNQMLDWSGYSDGSNAPHEVINGARTFLWYNFTAGHPVICFQDTWDSAKAGLASFKLTVSAGLTDFDNTGVSIGSQVILLQHQWLAGWMNLNLPTINEMSSISTTGTNQNPEGLGDATGDGKFFASNHWYQDNTGAWQYDATGTHLGEIRATVKGTLPLGQDFSELGIADADGNITLPDDWAKLARAGEPASDFATDGNPKNLNPAMRWDIHDEMVDQYGNVASGAGGRNGVGTTTKNVANVAADNPPSSNNPLTNNGDAWFTRDGVTTSQTPNPGNLPNSTFPTAGPFDPNYAGETLLPDGQLNAGDAPMPAARIDFSIAANTDPLHSIDGVGYFSDASKAHDYSLDYTGSNKTAGNLFVPFYSQYIPATSRDDIGYASGVDGALATDNFPGFLTWGRTPDWKAFTLDSASSLPTQCRLRGDQYGSTPGGPQTVAVYTDEHGEARVMYNPGTKFYFDAVNTTPGDSDKGCEFGQLLGTSTISVTARYPYQKVTDPDKVAKTNIIKKVYNLFDKHLSDYPKNDNSSTPNAKYARIVVAYAQDYTGQALQGETVCFSAKQDHQGDVTELLPTGDVNINRPGGGTFTVHGNGSVPADPNMKDWLCTTTDSHGYAPFEYSTSFGDAVDVLAYFPEEGLYRDIMIDAAHPYADNAPLTPAAALAAPPATSGAGANGTNAPSIDTIKAFGGILPGVVAAPAVTAAATATVTPAQTITPVTKITAKKAARLLILRLVRPAHGKAYFMIKVQSTHKTAKITLALKNKHGKTIKKITKTITANKLVKVKSSSITLSIKKIGVLLVK
jgi:hypothetical protein